MPLSGWTSPLDGVTMPAMLDALRTNLRPYDLIIRYGGMSSSVR